MKSDNAKYYIFGAHPRGYTMYQYLRTLEPEAHILGFLYDNDEKNPEELEGIKVSDLGKAASGELDTDATVYLGTRGVFHDSIKARLLAYGFSEENIIPVTPSLDMELRNEYVKRGFEEKGKDLVKLEADGQTENMSEIHASDIKQDLFDATTYLYIAKTIFDGDFSKPIALKDHECILQAGTAAHGSRLSDALFFDNDEENISDRNSQFCELTAMYWIWKNSDADVVGLEHWRRRFLLPDNWTGIMEEKGIDVILPVPLCVMPSLKENFVGRHLPEIWDASMDALKTVHPEDAVPADEYFKTVNLYSPCNMLIARKYVFDEYSEWLFPVLFELNRLIGKVEDNYQNRYPGFVSERLLNYYFDIRRGDLNIAYADKSFLS